MPNHDEVYQQHAEQYELLISKEDYQQNLPNVFQKIRPYSGLDIIDMGTGTGRLTCLLANSAKSIIALDNAQPMLDVIEKKLQTAGLTNWRTELADHRKLPINDQSADLVVAGWTICYIASSNVENWEANLTQSLKEMNRILRPGGMIILFETMGTARETPQAPGFLNPYFDLLEKYGFSHTWIRTDYLFDSVKQAEQLTRFFFGDQMASHVLEHELRILPECTGVWWIENEKLSL